MTKSSTEPGINCSNCKHFNSLTSDTCSKCETSLFPDEDEEEQPSKSKPKPEEKKDLAACSKCSYENDPTNAYCVNCEKKFKPKRIPKKSIRTSKAAFRKGRLMMGTMTPCPVCGEQVRLINHMTGETDICMKCEEKNPSDINKSLCLFCDNKIKPSDEKTHDDTCEERRKFFSKS